MFRIKISSFNYWIFLAPGPAIPGRYWILGTDYENYTSIYDCSQVGNVPGTEFGWLNTREMDPPQEIVSKVGKNQVQIIDMMYCIIYGDHHHLTNTIRITCRCVKFRTRNIVCSVELQLCCRDFHKIPYPIFCWIKILI